MKDAYGNDPLGSFVTEEQKKAKESLDRQQRRLKAIADAHALLNDPSYKDNPNIASLKAALTAVTNKTSELRSQSESPINADAIHNIDNAQFVQDDSYKPNRDIVKPSIEAPKERPTANLEQWAYDQPVSKAPKERDVGVIEEYAYEQPGDDAPREYSPTKTTEDFTSDINHGIIDDPRMGNYKYSPKGVDWKESSQFKAIKKANEFMAAAFESNELFQGLDEQGKYKELDKAVNSIAEDVVKSAALGGHKVNIRNIKKVMLKPEVEPSKLAPITGDIEISKEEMALFSLDLGVWGQVREHILERFKHGDTSLSLEHEFEEGLYYALNKADIPNDQWEQIRDALYSKVDGQDTSVVREYLKGTNYIPSPAELNTMRKNVGEAYYYTNFLATMGFNLGRSSFRFFTALPNAVMKSFDEMFRGGAKETPIDWYDKKYYEKQAQVLRDAHPAVFTTTEYATEFARAMLDISFYTALTGSPHAGIFANSFVGSSTKRLDKEISNRQYVGELTQAGILTLGYAGMSKFTGKMTPKLTEKFAGKLWDTGNYTRAQALTNSRIMAQAMNAPLQAVGASVIGGTSKIASNIVSGEKIFEGVAADTGRYAAMSILFSALGMLKSGDLQAIARMDPETRDILLRTAPQMTSESINQTAREILEDMVYNKALWSDVKLTAMTLDNKELIKALDNLTTEEKIDLFAITGLSYEDLQEIKKQPYATRQIYSAETFLKLSAKPWIQKIAKAFAVSPIQDKVMFQDYVVFNGVGNAGLAEGTAAAIQNSESWINSIVDPKTNTVIYEMDPNDFYDVIGISKGINKGVAGKLTVELRLNESYIKDGSWGSSATSSHTKPQRLLPEPPQKMPPIAGGTTNKPPSPPTEQIMPDVIISDAGLIFRHYDMPGGPKPEFSPKDHDSDIGGYNTFLSDTDSETLDKDVIEHLNKQIEKLGREPTEEERAVMLKKSVKSIYDKRRYQEKKRILQGDNADANKPIGADEPKLSEQDEQKRRTKENIEETQSQFERMMSSVNKQDEPLGVTDDAIKQPKEKMKPPKSKGIVINDLMLDDTTTTEEPKKPSDTKGIEMPKEAPSKSKGITNNDLLLDDKDTQYNIDADEYAKDIKEITQEVLDYVTKKLSVDEKTASALKQAVENRKVEYKERGKPKIKMKKIGDVSDAREMDPIDFIIDLEEQLNEQNRKLRKHQVDAKLHPTREEIREQIKELSYDALDKTIKSNTLFTDEEPPDVFKLAIGDGKTAISDHFKVIEKYYNTNPFGKLEIIHKHGGTTHFDLSGVIQALYASKAISSEMTGEELIQLVERFEAENEFRYWRKSMPGKDAKDVYANDIRGIDNSGFEAPEILEFIKSITGEVPHVRELADGVLSFYDVDTGRMVFNKDIFDKEKYAPHTVRRELAKNLGRLLDMTSNYEAERGTMDDKTFYVMKGLKDFTYKYRSMFYEEGTGQFNEVMKLKDELRRVLRGDTDRAKEVAKALIEKINEIDKRNIDADIHKEIIDFSLKWRPLESDILNQKVYEEQLKHLILSKQEVNVEPPKPSVPSIRRITFNEAFSDLTSAILTEPSYVEMHAPKAYKKFTELSNPVIDRLLETLDTYNNILNIKEVYAERRERMEKESLKVVDEVINKQPAIERRRLGWWAAFKQYVVDDLEGIRALGREMKLDDNTINRAVAKIALLRNTDCRAAITFDTFTSLLREIDSLDLGDKSTSYLEEYMRWRSIESTAHRVANPFGFQIKHARGALDVIRKEVGDIAYNKMEVLSDKFLDWYNKEVITKAYEAGYFTQAELLQALAVKEQGDFYYPGIVAKRYIGDTYQPGAHREEIGHFYANLPPLLSYVERGSQIVRAYLRNQQILSLVKEFKLKGERVSDRMFDETIAPKGQKYLFYRDDGVEMAVLVDNFVAQGIDRHYSSPDFSFAKFISAASKVAKSIITEYNPAFVFVSNPIKDTQSTDLALNSGGLSTNMLRQFKFRVKGHKMSSNVKGILKPKEGKKTGNMGGLLNGSQYDTYKELVEKGLVYYRALIDSFSDVDFPPGTELVIQRMHEKNVTMFKKKNNIHPDIAALRLIDRIAHVLFRRVGGDMERASKYGPAIDIINNEQSYGKTFNSKEELYLWVRECTGTPNSDTRGVWGQAINHYVPYFATSIQYINRTVKQAFGRGGGIDLGKADRVISPGTDSESKGFEMPRFKKGVGAGSWWKHYFKWQIPSLLKLASTAGALRVVSNAIRDKYSDKDSKVAERAMAAAEWMDLYETIPTSVFRYNHVIPITEYKGHAIALKFPSGVFSTTSVGIDLYRIVFDTDSPSYGAMETLRAFSYYGDVVPSTVPLLDVIADGWTIINGGNPRTFTGGYLFTNDEKIMGFEGMWRKATNHTLSKFGIPEIFDTTQIDMISKDISDDKLISLIKKAGWATRLITITDKGLTEGASDKLKTLRAKNVKENLQDKLLIADAIDAALEESGTSLFTPEEIDGIALPLIDVCANIALKAAADKYIHTDQTHRDYLEFVDTYYRFINNAWGYAVRKYLKNGNKHMNIIDKAFSADNNDSMVKVLQLMTKSMGTEEKMRIVRLASRTSINRSGMYSGLSRDLMQRIFEEVFNEEDYINFATEASEERAKLMENILPLQKELDEILKNQN